jgi:CBS domain-containing protein
MRYLTATRVAASVGQGVALVFGGVGLFSLFFGHLGPISNPFLLLIGIFVWIGARREAGMVELKSSLGGVPVAHLMITHFRTLSPQDPLREAVAALLASSQRDFPVMDANVPVGLLSHSRLIAAVKQHGEDVLVGDVMEREFFSVQENESADRAMEELNSNASEVLLVLKDGRLKGLVTREHLRQVTLVRAALSGLPARSEPALPLERKAA